MLKIKTTNRYDKYKDSGIEWIGEIPDSWCLQRLKTVGDYRNGLTYAPEDICEENNGTLVLRSSNIKEGKISLDDNVYVSSNIPQRLKVKKGDILICSRNGSRDLIGKNALITEDINASFGAFMMIFRCNNPKYFYYILNSHIFNYYLGSFFTSTINQLTGTNFGNMRIVYCPNIKEQESIAGYLDLKCGAIDETIEKQKSVIEKLKEYKQSIITQAVTKGLDKSAPMKDSGIEWIGQIPQHWEIIKFKNCISKIADIDHYMPNSVDNGYPYLMTGDLKEYASQINFDICKKISSEDYIDLATKIHPQKDDIIFARYATIGTLCYVDISKEFLVSYSCLTIRPLNAKVLGKFIFYYLKSDIFTNEIMQYVNSNTQSNIGLDSLKRILVILPNVIEQKQIISYLDKKCSEIDKTIEDKEKLIEKLVEYKKSLIYECVTGKRKVI